MSGTSADGIDAALVNIDGAPPTLNVQLIQHLTFPHDPALQTEIFACFRPETGTVDRLNRLNIALGDAFATATLRLLDHAKLTPDAVDLIGSHGQTLWYEPPGVLALGEPAVIAERTGITTISHFRSRDLAAGGLGAPLVAYLDWLLFRHPTQARAIQNIGGIGNVTGLPPLNAPPDQVPVTFDTGPGNMLMDRAVERFTNGALRYDQDGKIAGSGTVNQPLLDTLMAIPYFVQPPPKATGRELFGVQFADQVYDQGLRDGVSAETLIATLTAFTAQTIAHAIQTHIPYPVSSLYVAGGGAFNPTLLQMIAERLPGVTVARHDQLGLAAEAKEAVLFAVLAYESWHNRPSTLPTLTGARHSSVLGSITLGRRTTNSD
jgi:anhydro-N-acetylmuramic acid kinase